jgi:hypothetical protein
MIALQHILLARTSPIFFSRRPSTNRQVLVLLAAIAALCLAPTTSTAGQIALSPDSVIGGNGSLNDGGSRWNSTDPEQGEGFNARRVADSILTEDSSFNFWLVNADNTEGLPYFVLDLGDSYSIDEFNLFNTHNRHANNFATREFRILASNSVVDTGTNGSDLSGTIETILDSALGDTDNQSPVLGQTRDNITPHSEVGVRYLKFIADSGRTNENYKDENRGLNEIQVFGQQAAVIPEPSTLILAAFGLLGFLRRRK